MMRIDEIKAQIVTLEKELKEIQECCPHPPLTHRYLYQSSTGNWDRSDDHYWTDNHCTLCGKHWSVDGSKSGLKGSTQVKDYKDL